MIKLSIKTKFMRAATMLLLMLLTTTTAWAGDTKILYDNSTEAKAAAGGSLYFYSNEACNAIISVNKDNNASSGSMVYIKARPDGIHKFGATDDNNLVSFIRVEVVTPNNDGGVLPVSKFADGIYTFTMPSDASFHVSVTVNFPERSKNADALTYIDEDGVEQTKAAGTVYVLDGSEFTLGVDDQEIWYIAQGTDLAYTHTLSYYGNMHLILANGAAMSVTASGYDDGFHATGNSSLTICGQGGETEGSLTVRGYDGIDTEGNVIICSGIIDIASNSEGDGICASNITICGGQVTATGGSFGSSYGLNAGNNITLGWHKNTDRIMATGRDYAGYSTDVNIATDQRFVAFNAPTGTAASTIVSGTVDDVTLLAGKTLKPLDGPVVSIGGEGFSFGKDADFVIDDTHYYKYAADDNVTLSYTGSGIVQVTGATLAAVANEPLQRTFTMPATDVALTATTVTDLTATDIIYGEATPEIKQGDDVFATANYAFVYKSGDEVITEPTVGTYTCTLTGQGQYFGTTNVAIKVKPRPITIAAGRATKKYDGTPLTSPYYECTLIDPDDRLNGIPILNNDTIASLTITGSQTNVGSSVNVPSGAVITRRGDTTVDITSNYDIAYASGTLTVITNDTLITVIPGSSSKVYDGMPLTMTAHDDFTVTGVPDGLTWEATADGIVTNVTPGEGEKSENAVTSFKIFDANHLDVTNYFTNINKDQVGTLTILPRQTSLAVEIVDPVTTIDGHPILISGDDAHVKVTLVPVNGANETTELPKINGIATIIMTIGEVDKSYTVAIVNGEGHYYVNNLGQAAYDITAEFNGDANHAESTTETATTLEACKILTETTCIYDKTPVNESGKLMINVGETITFTINVNEVGLERPVIDSDTGKNKAYSFASSRPLSVDALCLASAQTPYDIEHDLSQNHYDTSIVNGCGIHTFSHLSAGPRSLRAIFAGNDRYTNSSSIRTDLQVNKTATTVAVEVTSPVIAK